MTVFIRAVGEKDWAPVTVEKWGYSNEPGERREWGLVCHGDLHPVPFTNYEVVGSMYYGSALLMKRSESVMCLTGDGPLYTLRSVPRIADTVHGAFKDAEVTGTLRLPEGIFVPLVTARGKTRKTQKIHALGKIKLDAVYGNACTVVNTARTSTGGQQVKKMGEADNALLRFLLENEHDTPLETVVIRLHIKAPIFVLRQWMRHRMCAFNEASQRYRVANAEWFVPWDDDGLSPESIQALNQAQRNAHQEYTRLLDTEYSRIEKLDLPPEGNERQKARARARELLRICLPLGTYSSVVWTVNLRSFLHFVRLRTDQAAQEEIRDYANAAWELFARKRPELADAIVEAGRL